MKKFALIGENVSFSKSPDLHNEIAKKNHRELIYYPISVPREDFADKIKDLLNVYDGLNVTMPYKIEIIPYLDEMSAVAKLLGVVNTVVRKRDGTLYGDNTDVYGIRKSLQLHDVCLTDKSVLIIGSGATATSFAYVAKTMGAKISFFARNLNACRDICSRLGIKAESMENTSSSLVGGYHVIANATPIGSPSLAGNSPLNRFYDVPVLFDCVYEPLDTPFLHNGGATTVKISGIEMLRFQAERAQEVFFAEN